MPTTDADTLFAALRTADPDVMDRDELALTMTHVAQLSSWLESVRVRVTRRQRQLADDGRGEAPRDLLTRHGGQSGKDARAADERERGASRPTRRRRSAHLRPADPARSRSRGARG